MRGQLVREFGNLLREHKEDLGALVSIEAGKIRSEGQGEVQEMIDVCDLAVGQSRQLFGLTIASERPGHRMMEQWHPLGVVGVISAFNFPVAVWSWNTALALVCGDAVVWKPSEKTILTALACQALLAEAARRAGAPAAVSSVVLGGLEVGRGAGRRPAGGAGLRHRLDPDGPRGRARGRRRASAVCCSSSAATTPRSSRPSADLDLTVRGIVFAAAGTAGQRCTTLRRVIAHSSIADELTDRLAAAYRSLPIGSPLADGTLVGPLIDAAALSGLRRRPRPGPGRGRQGRRRRPSGARGRGAATPTTWSPRSSECPLRATWCGGKRSRRSCTCSLTASLDEAIALHNDVPQGLSSSIFTLDLREAERFLAADGSDCGIANVNIGPSGAEIGGAFGGEKETGGGRESGSDAWKSYMRRATNTVNYSTDLPLAQGVTFG